MNAPSFLEVAGVTAGYRRGDPIVSDVDFHVKAGELVGLIGPNGCGKSTLIRVMSGMLPLTQGKVIVDGSEISSLSRQDLARRIAVLPQETTCTFPFTVREIVSMGRHPHLGRFRRLSCDDETVIEEALCRTHTHAFAERIITELSGGEKQRVLIARALAQKPRALFLDEPTAHLDINHQIEVFALMFQLSRVDDLSVICATHDLNLASTYCDRLVLMSNGIIYADGTPEEVLTAELMKDVYGATVSVEPAIRDNRPRILPLAINLQTGVPRLVS
tara:strand:+ start:219 stop:1043 length:825 start_codon:yes stop_codon:yes gene_type:complete